MRKISLVPRIEEIVLIVFKVYVPNCCIIVIKHHTVMEFTPDVPL